MSPQPTTYGLHGLSMASEVPLDAWRVESAEPDVVLSVAPGGAVSSEPPAGRLISNIEGVCGHRLLTVTEYAGRYFLRYHGLADITVSNDLRSVGIALDPSAKPDIVSTIATSGLGGFLATMAGLRAGTEGGISGDIALHASAVASEWGAVAFVGCSGSGKSTLAALACTGSIVDGNRTGFGVLGDDTLRVGTASGTAVCFPGSRTLRLRPGATALAHAMPGGPPRRSSDDRWVVEPAPADMPGGPLSPVPLAAVLLPEPGGASESPRAERLDAHDAMAGLLAAPRLANARDAGVLKNHLSTCASLVRSIPVFALQLPPHYWLRPRAAEKIGDLLSAGVPS